MNDSNNFPLQMDNQKAEADRKNEEQREQIRKDMLLQCLDQSARARLSNIAALKPEKARMAENYIFSRASQGQLTGKITEPELIKLLDSIAQNTKPNNKVIFDRRRAALDSDDEDF